MIYNAIINEIQAYYALRFIKTFFISEALNAQIFAISSQPAIDENGRRQKMGAIAKCYIDYACAIVKLYAEGII
jgi:hypothetical protein